MAEIVNLRQARKRKRRADKERAAAANRIDHGRPRPEKAKEQRLRELDHARLDGHRRDAPGDGET